MRKRYQLIFFLKYFASGLIMPVFTLVLLKHGATISTASLLMGAYSLTAIAAELPSGILADLYGRKNSFLLSCVLALLAFSLLLASKTAPFLLAVLVFLGLSRAFSSGSLDALALDDTVASGGILAKATSRLSILESTGLASGALAGGGLAGWGSSYEGILMLILSLHALLLLMTAFFVREQPRISAKHATTEMGKYRQFGHYIKFSFTFMIQKNVRMLFVFSLLTGFALLSIETYWQPGLAALSPASWVLGVVSFAGFVGVILGSGAVERFLTKRPKDSIPLLLITKALFGICLILLAFQSRTPLFIVVYVLAYLFLGGSSVTENTLLNDAVSSSQRASILSLFSLALQIGGLVASLCGYLVSQRMSFRGMWPISGVLILVGVGIFTLEQRRRSTIEQLPLSDEQEASIPLVLCEIEADVAELE